MSMIGRRSNVEIIGDILRLGKSGKTAIMYDADLSYYQLQKYLQFLTDRGFLEQLPATTPNNKSFNPTDKGEQLLGQIDKVIDFLSPNEGGKSEIDTRT